MNSINNALMIYNVGVWQRMLDSVCLMYISVKYISICETLVAILLYNSMLPYLFSYIPYVNHGTLGCTIT